MTSKNEPARRLIEEWLPINEISIEAITGTLWLRFCSILQPQLASRLVGTKTI